MKWGKCTNLRCSMFCNNYDSYLSECLLYRWEV